jgi:mono/diheme cytochrome c family protein
MQILSACIAAVVLAAAGGAVAVAAEPAARQPSAVRGRQLYVTVGCVHCHGTEGQGSTAGAKLAPDPLPAEAIAAFIRTPNTQMPAYSAQVLGDAEVADIAAFLRSLAPPKPADAIPALRALKGVP